MAGVLRNLFPALFALIISGLHYGLSYAVAPQFHELFSGFGTELPMVARLSEPGSLLYWVAPALVWILSVSSMSGGISKASVYTLGSLLTAISLAMFLISVYWPVFG